MKSFENVLWIILSKSFCLITTQYAWTRSFFIILAIELCGPYQNFPSDSPDFIAIIIKQFLSNWRWSEEFCVSFVECICWDEISCCWAAERTGQDMRKIDCPALLCSPARQRRQTWVGSIVDWRLQSPEFPTWKAQPGRISDKWKVAPV